MSRPMVQVVYETREFVPRLRARVVLTSLADAASEQPRLLCCGESAGPCAAPLLADAKYTTPTLIALAHTPLLAQGRTLCDGQDTS